MSSIHSTAIIEEGAAIGKNVSIGPYCIIGSSVTIGDRTIIKSHVAIEGVTRIGPDCKIYPFASLGSAPQDLKYGGEKSELVVGSNNIIREYTTMNTGTVGGGMKTVVGDNCLFMMAAHVAHDCVVGNNVIMANNATLGGHVHVGDYAVIGGLAAVHQFVRVGEHSIIGGVSAVVNDVIPYGRVKGDRAHLAGLNLVGLERAGFSKEDIRNVQRAFNQLFDDDEGTLEQRLESVGSEFSNDKLVMNIIEFALAKTKFPLCLPPKKAA